jgi:hypothetical protein
MAVQFFYDQQLRRFLLQFTRMLSNFQVQFGSLDPNTGKPALQTVPVFYGDASRQASQILRNQSENMMPSVPAMAFYISAMVYDRQRMQDPTYIGKMQIRERKIDPTTGMPTHEQGDAYSVERPMPVPFILTVKLDIWTSNTEQKFQLIEQIGTLFNPALEIQSTDNYIDWTSLSYVQLTDIQWTGRTVPMGTDSESIDIATLTFEIPVWISPPAKVTKLGVIQKIVASVFNSSGNLSEDIFNPEQLLTRRDITVLGYGVVLVNNTLELLRYNDTVTDTVDGDILINTSTVSNWHDLVNVYGTLQSGISQIRLELEIGTELIGTVAYHPTDTTKLLFTPFADTVPVNTLPAVNAIIDPLRVNASQLLYDNSGNYKIATGTRFLILNDIGSLDNLDFATAWSPHGVPVVAHTNDIIEYDGTRWFVSFDSQHHDKLEYVTNLTTGVQYKWKQAQWAKSYEGVYREDRWRIIL